MHEDWESQQGEFIHQGKQMFMAGESSPQRSYHRNSLGSLIERSTSAPPSSSTEENLKLNSHGDDTLVGDDLLRQVSGVFHELEDGPSSSAVSTDVHPPRSQSTDDRWLGDDLYLGSRSGRSTAPSNYLRNASFGSPRSLSAIEIEGDGNQYPEMSRHAFAGGLQPLAGGLVRSRSAQPSAHEDRSSRSTAGDQSVHRFEGRDRRVVGSPELPPRSRGVTTRPASTGIIDSNHAHRPSAKTLMDLIQDDYPEQAGVMNQYGMSKGVDRQTKSPAAVARPVRSDYGKFSSPNSPSLGQSDHSRSIQQRAYDADPYNRSGVEQSQSDGLHYRFKQMVITEDGRRYSPSEELPHQPYQIGHQQHGLQQKLYFEDSVSQYHRLEIPSSGVSLSHQRQQILPNGQTVFVNSQAPPQGFGYATTVRYPNSQTQLIHQQQVQRSIQSHNDPFVSVVPVQGGPQIAYWQTEQQQSLGPTMTVINHRTPERSPAALNRMQQVPVDHGGMYGQSRGPERASRGRRGGRRGDSKGSAHTLGSPLLEDFRASRTRDWTLYQIEGHVVEFCQDQNGSRFIQQRLEMGDPLEQEVVVREILPAIRRLRNDVFGNYVVQKLLDFGTPAMKEAIRKTLEGEMLQLSLQMYGCRVVQKALEALDEESLPHLLQEFHHNVLSCIHDQNGNHVIQKCIEVMNHRAKKAETNGEPDRADFLRDQVSFIVDDVLFNTPSLSCHPYGCRVLQRILEHCDEEKKTAVLDEIRKCHQRLLDDQYGNYVIQHVLQFGRPSDRDSILAIVAENGLLELSRQKFASNVVEKLLKYGNSSQRRAVAREMLKNAGPNDPTDGGKSVALLMVRDAYANYVVQTTLDVIPDSTEKNMLLEELNSHSEELKNYTFAKHIVSKLSIMNNKQ